MLILKSFRLDPRYQKMDASERSNYRKDVMFRLVALGCIYAGFTGWWLLMSHFTG